MEKLNEIRADTMNYDRQASTLDTNTRKHEAEFAETSSLLLC